MIIQNTPPMNQAVQPDSVAPVRSEPRAVAVTPAQTPPVQPSPEELKSAVAFINRTMQQMNSDLQFTVDTDTHKTVVKMVDTSTGELLRQFPSEATLAISRGIDQFQQGLLFKQKA